MQQRCAVALLSCAALLLSGCATNRWVCATIGGLAGGAGGVAVSDPDDHEERAAAIGVVGAALGAYLGYHWCGAQRVNQSPSVRLNMDPTRGDPPLNVDYRAVGNDPDGTITGYFWDFGDGSTSSEQNGTHTYREPGTYLARVTVTDSDGATSTAERQIIVAGAEEEEAAPVVQRRIVLRGVNFGFDSADIGEDSQSILDVAVQALRENSGVQVEVAGHTDSTGPEAYNQGLSERRARAVLDYLEAGGISRSRLSSVGYGESQPVADNSTRDGRAQNRRVELNIPE